MSVLRFCYDDETGEIVTYPVNEETGEPVFENSPSYVYASTYKDRRSKKKSRKVSFRKGYSTNRKKFQTLQANIMAGSNTVSHRLLLIPTMMFFPALLCAMLMILEIFLHVRCHKKNKSLKDPNLYYRSPFHIVTSTFCGVCRESQSACKVGQLQDQRRCRYDYLKAL